MRALTHHTIRFNYLDNNVLSIAFLLFCFHSVRCIFIVRSLAHRFIQGKLNSKRASRDEIIDEDGFVRLKLDRELEYRTKNRQLSHSAITSALSAFYAKVIVVLGIAFPVTDILAVRAPNAFYQGFYLFLYLGSIAFVLFMYVDHLRTKRIYSSNASGKLAKRLLRRLFIAQTIFYRSAYFQSKIDYFFYISEKDKKNSSEAKARLGSFYLRVGAVAFGIGSMVYSGLEFGQYFELKGNDSMAI